MKQVHTHIAHLPTAYRCAVEMLDNGDRTQERYNGLVEHFATSYGLQSCEHHEQWKFDGWCIAKRRYFIEA